MFKGRPDNHYPDRIKMIDIKNYYSKEEQHISIFMDCFSVIFVMNGKALFVMDDEEYTIHAPTLVCLSNRDPLSKLILYKNTKISIIYFDTTFLTKGMSMERVFENDFTDFIDRHYFCQLRPFIEKAFRKKYFILDNTLSKYFSQLIFRINSQLVEQPDYYWPCRARSGLLEILTIIEKMLYDSILSKERISADFTDEKEEFRLLLEYVISNLDTNIKMEDLYKQFFLNAQTIERLFHKYCKMTYKQYIRNQRFEIAKHNLRFTKLSLKEIARKVGYSSTQSFCKFFKEMSGTTPIAFRKEQVLARRSDPKLKPN